ncbi:HAMP domain-containing sensor histidine kinase [Nocardioides zeae]|uniref:histidine kinase n=1 Tax=Nocardioides imazamoxiresistens TaxID=3231893 RepID=A0ABU3Q0I8_9ACTN|nr:HAMP domain-containing sensor histidine kinase [Nocardioides zeae]MDT9595033.1 HAMP domain-containing sensor histidine kinase [Nocardioides zeae]
MRLRITTTVAVLVALALAGAGTSFYLIEERRIEVARIANIDQELAEFRQLARSPGPYSTAPDPETGEAFTGVADLLFGYVQSNVPTEDELLVGWWDDGVEVRQDLDGDRDEVAAADEFADAVRPLVEGGGYVEVTVDGLDLFLTVQPASAAAPDGSIQSGALVVVSYVDVADRQLVETIRTYAVVAAVALLLVVGVAAVQSGRLLRPLRVLRRSAEEISETDLTRRVPETGNDDITALTRTVNGMLDRIENAFVGQRQFLDDAGHELRTPLTILGGHLELLEVDGPEAAETRDLLLDEVDRMSRLVEDLLLLAKSDRPDFLSLRPVEVADLLPGVLAKARALGERRWTLEVPPERPRRLLTADEQRLTQALLQLCGNAVKHTREGDVVAIGYDAPAPGRVRLWVRDTGPGVPEADRERIFERFGRSEVAPDDDGFGLGLSIVSAIVAAHDGTIHVEQADPPGARFVIGLPALPPTTGTPSAPADHHVQPDQPDQPGEDPTRPWPAS